VALKIGMLFPDYASQFVGMAKELYDNSRLIQEYFEEASNCLNINFIKLCFASSDSELSKIIHAYPSLFLVSSAVAALLHKKGIIPHKVAGYNLGEYAALCSIGSLTLPDGLYFLSKFAVLYQEKLEDLDVRTITISGLSERMLQEQLRVSNNESFHVGIAAYRTHNVHTLTGMRNGIDALELQVLKNHKAHVSDIPTEAGLHSPFMDSVVSSLKMYSEKIDIYNAPISFVSGVDGVSTLKGTSIKEKLIHQISSPILWKNVMKDMDDCDMFVHIGPGNTLSYTTRVYYSSKPLFTINKQSDLDKLMDYLRS